MIDRALGLRLISDEPVFGIEEQDAELLDPLPRQHRVQIGEQLFPIVQNGAFAHFFPRQTQCGGLDAAQRGDAGLPQALNLAKFLHRRTDGPGEGPKAPQQGAGDRLGVAPGQSQKQHHFQQFVIQQRIRPGAQQLFAHAGAMPQMAGGCLGHIGDKLQPRQGAGLSEALGLADSHVPTCWRLERRAKSDGSIKPTVEIYQPKTTRPMIRPGSRVKAPVTSNAPR